MTDQPLPPRPPSFIARFFNTLGNIIATLIFGGFALIAVGIAMLVAPGPHTDAITVIVPKNSGTIEIGKILADAGAVYNQWQFALPAHLIAQDGLRAGEYALEPKMTVLDIIGKLQSGTTVIRKISIPEGLTAAEIVALLKAEPVLSGEIAEPPAEGSLLPETYHYSYGDARPDLLKRMNKLSTTLFTELWQKREADLPFTTPEEARTLASIVEKETGKPEERARVAGVFVNRLRQGIRLQSDPTVIYAVTQGKAPLGRLLTRDDLQLVSPYNTYVVAGLPPGPIANPGRAALAAVLHPEKHDFIYFVADGSGGHVFARTLDEHNANVAKWRKLNAN